MIARKITMVGKKGSFSRTQTKEKVSVNQDIRTVNIVTTRFIPKLVIGPFYFVTPYERHEICEVIPLFDSDFGTKTNAPRFAPCE